MTVSWAEPASAFRRVALLAGGTLVWEAAARSGKFSPLIVPSVT